MTDSESEFMDYRSHHERRAIERNASPSIYGRRPFKQQVVISERFGFYANNKISEWIESFRMLYITAYCKANNLKLVIHDSKFDDDDEHVVQKPIQERSG